MDKLKDYDFKNFSEQDAFEIAKDFGIFLSMVDGESLANLIKFVRQQTLMEASEICLREYDRLEKNVHPQMTLLTQEKYMAAIGEASHLSQILRTLE